MRAALDRTQDSAPILFAGLRIAAGSVYTMLCAVVIYNYYTWEGSWLEKLILVLSDPLFNSSLANWAFETKGKKHNVTPLHHECVHHRIMN